MKQSQKIHIKPLFRFVCSVAIIFSSLVGVFYNTGFMDGRFAITSLVFYTLQSNILVFLAFLYFAWRDWLALRGKVSRTLTARGYFWKGCVTLAIVVTGLVYNLILAPMAGDISLYGINLFGNFLVHTLTPSLVFVSWLLFDDKTKYRWFYPLAWIAIPLAYFAFAMFRAVAIGGDITPVSASRYPYFFIDIDKYELWVVLRNVAVLVVCFAALGYAMLAIGKIGHKKRQKNLS